MTRSLPVPYRAGSSGWTSCQRARAATIEGSTDFGRSLVRIARRARVRYLRAGVGDSLPSRPGSNPARERPGCARMLLSATARSLMKSASAISRLAAGGNSAATSRSRGVSPRQGVRQTAGRRAAVGLRPAARVTASRSSPSGRVPPGARRPPRLPPLRGVLRLRFCSRRTFAKVRCSSRRLGARPACER